jgi:hypothetical protein
MTSSCYRIRSAGRDFLVVNGYRIPIDPPANQINDLIPRHLLFTSDDGSGSDRCHSGFVHRRPV